MVVSAALDAVRAAIVPGVSTADLNAIAERVIADAGATSNFKGYRGGGHDPVPGGHLRVGQRRGRARHPRSRAPVARRRHHLDRLRRRSSTAGTATPPSRRVSGRSIPPSSRCSTSARSRCGAASRPAWRAAGSATSATRSSRTSGRRAPYGIVEEYGGHGIGTEMHQQPHVANHGRRGQRAVASAGPDARRRADDHDGQAARRHARRRLDGRDRRWQLGGPLRTHVRRHARRARRC